eukprot:COSAG02_NODE_267_length_26570_cov_7.008235_8_plen_73_part_00
MGLPPCSLRRQRGVARGDTGTSLLQRSGGGVSPYGSSVPVVHQAAKMDGESDARAKRTHTESVTLRRDDLLD